MSVFRRRFDEDYYESLIYRTDPRSHRNRMRLRLILEQKPNGRMLDIGIGRGDLMLITAAHFDVHALDVSPHAASRLPADLKARVTTGNVETCALPTPPYDVVTAFNILEHLRRPAAVIAKVREALAPGGVFIGSMPSNTHWVGSLHTAVTNYFDKTHRSTYKVATWRKAFARAGFSEVRFFGEIMIDGLICAYIRSAIWPHVSLNLMFVARRPDS